MSLLSFKSNPPTEYLCPLSQRLMKDPVKDQYGNYYDYLQIKEWLENHNTSPLNRQPLNINNLIHDENLKIKIKQWFDENLINNNNINDINMVDIIIPIEVGNYDLVMPKFNLFTDSKSELYLEIIPPNVTKRCSVNLVIIIDTSGSMNINANLNKFEQSNLSRLDLVKHAVKTIIKSLSDKDTCQLITFNSETTIHKTRVNHKYMNEDNKNDLISGVDKLEANYGTVICPAIEEGLKSFMNLTDGNNSIMLFTDGEAIDYCNIDKIKFKSNIQVHTFGYGYSINSKLLSEISKAGSNGIFTYIPDASIAGSVLVHAMANIFMTYLTNVVINFDNKTKIDIGAICYGQSRTIKINNFDNITINYSFNHNPCSIGLPRDYFTANINNNPAMIYNIRQDLIQLLNYIIDFNDNQTELLSKIEKFIMFTKEKNCHDEIIQGFIDDVLTEVKLGITPQNYKSWGEHYFRSLSLAHQYEFRNNFKDKSIKMYGGAQFNNMCTYLEQLFKDQTQTKIQNIKQYMDTNTVCFGGDTPLILQDGSIKLVKNIRQSDIVLCSNEVIYNPNKRKNYTLKDYGQIKFVIETKLTADTEMYKFGDLTISPWHPVMFNNEWSFPCEVFTEKIILRAGDSIYNFILDNHHTVYISDEIKCITLGHDYNLKPLKHTYFGSKRVVEDIKQIYETEIDKKIINPGDNVVISPENIYRNPWTGLIDKIHK